MTDNKEIILKALLASGNLNAPELPIEILRKAFEIEVEFQFEKDDVQAMKHLRSLIENHLGSTPKAGNP